MPQIKNQAANAQRAAETPTDEAIAEAVKAAQAGAAVAASGKPTADQQQAQKSAGDEQAK